MYLKIQHKTHVRGHNYTYLLYSLSVVLLTAAYQYTGTRMQDTTRHKSKNMSSYYVPCSFFCCMYCCTAVLLYQNTWMEKYSNGKGRPYTSSMIYVQQYREQTKLDFFSPRLERRHCCFCMCTRQFFVCTVCARIFFRSGYRVTQIFEFLYYNDACSARRSQWHYIYRHWYNNHLMKSYRIDAVLQQYEYVLSKYDMYVRRCTTQPVLFWLFFIAIAAAFCPTNANSKQQYNTWNQQLSPTQNDMYAPLSLQQEQGQIQQQHSNNSLQQQHSNNNLPLCMRIRTCSLSRKRDMTRLVDVLFWLFSL